MSKVRVILVRHGESENNAFAGISRASYLANRKADPQLTERGVKQAHAVAEWFRSSPAATLYRPVDCLFVSPFLRTMQTAKEFQTALQISPNVVTDIFESGGMYSLDDGVGVGGLNRDQMTTMFPGYNIPDDVDEDGWYVLRGQRDGKEKREHCFARAKRVVERLKVMAKELAKNDTMNEIDDNEDSDGLHHSGAIKRIVMVVHGDVMNDILCAALQCKWEHHVFEHYNTSVTSFDIYPSGETVLLQMNSVNHLTNESLCRYDTLHYL